MKFSKRFVSQSFTSVFAFLKLLLLEANGEVFIFRNLLHKKTGIMYPFHNIRDVRILTLTKQNKNNCHQSDKFEKNELWCYSHISERKKEKKKESLPFSL